MIKLLAAMTLVLSTSIFAEGLKKVNYQNATSETQDTKSPTSNTPALSPEASQKLNKDLEAIKKNQEASKKALGELDAEE